MSGQKRLVPQVVLVDDATMTVLQPALDMIAERVRPMLGHLREKNGWTVEMVAWSALLRALGTAVEQGIITYQMGDDDGGA